MKLKTLILNTEQASAMAGLSVARIKHYCQLKAFDCVQLGKQWAINRKDFEIWLQTRKEGD